MPPMIATRLAATEVSAMTATPSPIWRLRAEAYKVSLNDPEVSLIFETPPDTTVAG
jgi:hypothetical protein